MKRYNISHEYNIDLWDEGVTERKSFSRAWLYAALNPLRQAAERNLQMKQKNFRLSTAYLLYYDLLEKCGAAIDRLSENGLAVLPEDIDDAGDWERFAALAEKYGVVPLSAMPDEHCGHTVDALCVLNNRLRLGAKELAEGSMDKPALLAELTAILDEKIGVPPQYFNLIFMRADGETVTLERLTPFAFRDDICRFRPADYTVLENTEEAKRCAVRQLQQGEQVVVLADTRHQSNEMLGILDTDFVDSAAMFGSEKTVARKEKIRLGIIRPTTWLSLDGVHVEDGVPVRFKAQDSRGALVGADGHYTMSAAWFDEYVLSVVIHQKQQP